MNYNTTRKDLILPEYGRTIHDMVEHLKTIENRNTRNTAAQTLIEIMANKNPQIKDVADYMQKLWDHLYIMANFELDVDSPFPIPQIKLEKKPNIVNYSTNDNLKYKYYGKTILALIEKGMEMQEGDEKETFIEIIANLMKKFYLTYNRESVEDELINNHLQELSNGKLKIKADYNIDTTQNILSQKNIGVSNSSNPYSNNKRKKKKNNRKRKNYQK